MRNAMDGTELSIGDMVDLTIIRQGENSFLVGEVVGLRQQHFNPDGVSILVGGIDIWIDINDDVELRLADV